MARLRMEGVTADTEIPTPASGTATIFYNSTERKYKVKLDDGSVAPIGSGAGGGSWGSITGTLSSQTDLQNALDAKYDASNPASYVDAAQAALAAPVQSVNAKTGAITLNKSDIGLANVDNTSDADKPVSSATSSALALKYDASNPASYVNAVQAAAAAPVQSVAGHTGVVSLDKGDVGLNNVDNTSDLDKPISNSTATALANKYDASNPANYVNATQAAAAAPVQSVAGHTGVVSLDKGDVGLNNVDNTSDLDKPISNSTATALANKYDASNPASYVNATQAAAAAPVQSVAGHTGVVSLDKGDVGLNNVDNTSDADKPISTATANALSGKYDASNPANYVNAAGAASAAPVQSVAGKTGTVTLSKSDVGLSNVDNTSDADKPISTATASALSAKYDVTNPASYVNAAGAAAAAPVQSVAGKTGTVTLSKSDVGLSNVDNTSDADKPISTATASALSGKLSLSGGTMSGALNMGSQQINALLNPTLAQDAATKSYVDSVASGVAPIIQATAYVAKNGNDGTAQINNATKPFLTIAAAVTALNTAGYNTPNNSSMIYIGPGVYSENLTFLSNIGLSTLSGTLDYTVTVQGAHTYNNTTGNTSTNQVNLIGIQFQNPSNSASTLSFTGTAGQRMRVIDCSFDMGNNTGGNPTIYINNTGSSSPHIALWGRITQCGVLKSSATGDAVQIVNGGLNSYGYDLTSVGGNAVNISGGYMNFGYGTIGSAGSQVITASGGTASLSIAQVANSTSNKDGILQSGTSTVVCGITNFNIAGTTGYCARGTGTFLYNNLTFTGAAGNTRIQTSLTRLAITSTPTFVA